MSDYCLNCKKPLKPGRRGLWKYYCNGTCVKEASEKFFEAIRELTKDKHAVIVTLKGVKPPNEN